MRSLRRRLALAAFIVSLWTPSLGAQDAGRSRTITLNDYFTQADVGQLALSPKEDFIVYSEARWREATDDRKSDLWLVPCSEDRPARRLTADRANDRTPQWDAEGRSIYFLGNRKREGEKHPPYDGKTQVWRIPAAGGAPEPITQVAGGVSAFALPRVGRFLYYLVSHEAIQDDWSGLRTKHKHLEYGHGINQLSAVWKIDVDSFRAEKVVEPGRHIHEFAVAGGGGRIAMITTPDDKVVSFEGRSRVDVFDSTTGKTITVPDGAFRARAPSPYGWLEHLAWSADGQALAFNVVFDGYPAEIAIVRWEAGTAETFLMPRKQGIHVKGYGSPLAWRGTGRDLCFLGEQAGRVRLWCVHEPKPGGPAAMQPMTRGADEVVDAFSLGAPDAKHPSFAVVRATPKRFSDVWFSPDDGLMRRVTHVNPQADTWKLPAISIHSWTAADGRAVEGILELPPDYKPGQKVPLVVAIHGGPTTASYYKREFWIYGRTLLPAHGIAVLCPNYRGSTGYGDSFVTDLLGKENDVDVSDILRGVDALVERGIADPSRLAVSGWSNGGYLTNCILTKTTRFKAAISGAGIVDAIMEWGSNDEPAYAMVFKGGLPWKVPENYHRASPTYHLDKIRTPTLIHVGGNDERCPPGHSRMLYRALKEYNGVPTELVVYPGEPHGLMKYRSRRAKMEWDLAWLDRYLLGKK